MNHDLEKIISGLKLEEKASLCSGLDFWNTKSVERLGIASWMMTDGPHGLRKQKSDSGQVGLNDSVPATCFPTGAGLASTWNRALIQEVGEALGRECKAEKVGVILGPAVNIKRSPLCGRNFEYLSEDPFLAGEMATHHIRGVQSQGVGTSIKHFAVNNQEKSRMLIDAVVDERSLREIYLPAFEIPVREAQPWTVMCSYNRVNGTYSSENPWLLTTVLKEEWGHEGLVVTDWGACDDRVEGLKAGLEFEMPGNGGITDRDIVDAVRAGTLEEAVLDGALKRILELTFRVLDNIDPEARFDREAHHRLARRVASETMVLLKNEGSLLPLAKGRRIAFVGAFARKPRFQGGGSSHMTPTFMDDALAEARRIAGSPIAISYADGYSLESEASDPELLAEAKKVASEAETAVVFIGLTDRIESEGYDRTNLGIPKNHLDLLEAVLSVQKNLVVVLSNGSPIEMPWLDRVPAVLESYLGGQAWGGAVADILFGVANPSGKLAETFPARLEDGPSYLNFPGEKSKVEYREGLFVGYRYFDSAHVKPLFPFGHGLSYTKFLYSGLKTGRKTLKDSDTLSVSLEVKNSGSVRGKEVVQLYVRDLESSVIRPMQELKGFEKIELEPGETKTVEFRLTKRAFAFWSVEQKDWIAESGQFEIAVGASSRDIRLKTVVELESTASVSRVWDQNACLRDLLDLPDVGDYVRDLMGKFRGVFGSYEPGSAEAAMTEAMVTEMPLRNLVRMGGGLVTREGLALLLDVLNGRKPARALK
jgi:beta-glucosidase